MTEFISRKYGTESYEVIIKTDSHEHYKAAEDFARRLIDHTKPVPYEIGGVIRIPLPKDKKVMSFNGEEIDFDYEAEDDYGA